MANTKQKVVSDMTPFAHIRVGSRGGAYIPSEEIASLPEVRDMQQRAAMIVGRKAAPKAKEKA